MDKQYLWLVVVVAIIAIFVRTLRRRSKRSQASVVPMQQGSSEPTQDEFFDYKGKGAYQVEAVGERQYQNELRTIVAGHSGYVTLECEAELYCEDNNPYDSNAVRVMIQGKTVGYLSRPLAPFYRQAIRTGGFGKATAKCRAKIFGGSEAKPSYGVWLDI